MTTYEQKLPKPTPSLITEPLFPDLPVSVQKRVRRYKRVREPIWTENKARFIEHYLRFFVQITKHGAYIDGFAGPQYSEKPDAWAAALVLASEPKWLRHFFLCELTKRGVAALRELKKSQPEPRDKKGRKLPRTIDILKGDFNVNIEKILRPDKIAQKEATFCLLDQRTFECHWATVRSLAAYKKPPNKDKSAWEIAEIVRKRFEDELRYKSCAACPIFDRNKGNKVMYYMIHASDYDEAPRTNGTSTPESSSRIAPRSTAPVIRKPAEMN